MDVPLLPHAHEEVHAEDTEDEDGEDGQEEDVEQLRKGQEEGVDDVLLGLG